MKENNARESNKESKQKKRFESLDRAHFGENLIFVVFL